MREKVIVVLLALFAFSGLCGAIFGFTRGSNAIVGYGLSGLFSASILAVAYDDIGKRRANRRANPTENLD
jgi:hypothetical protein